MAPLQLLLLTELLHKLLDLPALLGVVALRIVHQDPLATLITAGWQMWVLVAARAKASGLSLPMAIFFFFLPLPWAAASAMGLATFPASRTGCECQACPFAALVHLSITLKRSKTSCTSCVDNFSSIFLSLMPYQNATTIEALEMRGMVFQTWKNRWMKDRSDSPGRCCTAWRSTSLLG
jgi:hypothetical protein